jgi:hypothetical protein
MGEAMHPGAPGSIRLWSTTSKISTAPAFRYTSTPISLPKIPSYGVPQLSVGSASVAPSQAPGLNPLPKFGNSPPLLLPTKSKARAAQYERDTEVTLPTATIKPTFERGHAKMRGSEVPQLTATMCWSPPSRGQFGQAKRPRSIVPLDRTTPDEKCEPKRQRLENTLHQPSSSKPVSTHETVGPSHREITLGREPSFSLLRDARAHAGHMKDSTTLIEGEMKCALDFLQTNFESDFMLNENLKTLIALFKRNPDALSRKEKESLRNTRRGAFRIWKTSLFGDYYLLQAVLRHGLFDTEDQQALQTALVEEKRLAEVKAVVAGHPNSQDMLRPFSSSQLGQYFTQ